MKRKVIIFEALIIALLSLFKLNTYSYISGTIAIEIIIATLDITFLA